VSSSWNWKKEGTTIRGDYAGDELGRSVALSADASIVAIGASGYDYFMGYVKVYHTNDDMGTRMQLGQTIFGDASYDLFGDSVDITPDGMTILCGSSGMLADDDRPGYVRVFSLEGDSSLGTDNWKQIGQDIIGEANGDLLGYSVSISGDGKTVAVGAPWIGGVNSGFVRMYRLVDDGTSWQKIGQDIYDEAAGDFSGHSVSLSADGLTVAVGAPWNNNNGEASGQVTVYRIDGEGSSWEQLGQSLYGDYSGDEFGTSVNLSPDGSIVAIGSISQPSVGYVRVLSLNGAGADFVDTWNPIGQDIVGDAAGEHFGMSVSLSDDGKTLAVGSSSADEKIGEASVYRMDESESNWIQIGYDIDGEAAGDISGWSVSLSADGGTLAIGSPYNDDNGDDSGHVRIFGLE
jgi:hypothetical protein